MRNINQGNFFTYDDNDDDDCRTGGLSSKPYGELRAENPRRLIEKAVGGMLPHNTLGRQQLTKLKVYAGPEHPHSAQKPTYLR